MDYQLPIFTKLKIELDAFVNYLFIESCKVTILNLLNININKNSWKNYIFNKLKKLMRRVTLF